MARRLTTADGASADMLYVELIGPDGLKHHVGPFAGRSRAEDWINQNAWSEAPAGAGKSVPPDTVPQPG